MDLEQTVYALDSTTSDLCLSLFPWARFRATKAAIKLHTLLDLRGPIPTMISITECKEVDLTILDELVLEPGAFFGMDRGYLDFERLYWFERGGAYFVKTTLRFRRVRSRKSSYKGPACAATRSSGWFGARAPSAIGEACAASIIRIRKRETFWCF